MQTLSLSNKWYNDMVDFFFGGVGLGIDSVDGTTEEDGEFKTLLSSK